MDNQDFSQLVGLFREIQGRITTIETQLTPAELTEHYVWRNIENTGETWQSLFLLADHVKSLTELYDNAENGFFLSLSEAKKEEIYQDMVYIANNHLKLHDQLQTLAPGKMTNADFIGIEENLALISRIKDFLVSKNLYIG